MTRKPKPSTLSGVKPSNLLWARNFIENFKFGFGRSQSTSFFHRYKCAIAALHFLHGRDPYQNEALKAGEEAKAKV
jgi:hypothetical protein